MKLCDAFIKARQVLAEEGKEVAKAKELIKNLEKTGNIFGEEEREEDEDED